MPSVQGYQPILKFKFLEMSLCGGQRCPYALPWKDRFVKIEFDRKQLSWAISCVLLSDSSKIKQKFIQIRNKITGKQRTEMTWNVIKCLYL